jgi:hypothetical protein
MAECIIDEIRQERKVQDTQWGHDFDDKNTLSDWVATVNQYMAKASGVDVDPDLQRKYVLQAGAIIVAALESFDRNNGFAPRHHETA